jgi:hypothetical protein
MRRSRQIGVAGRVFMTGQSFTALLLLAVACSGAHAQDAPINQPKRWGGALQVDLSSGGDNIQDEFDSYSNITLGQGLTLSGGLFFRPAEHSPIELQVLAGFKDGEPLPVVGGIFSDVSRWVFQFLADYRNARKWYWGGGVVLHGNPKLVGGSTYTGDLHFDDAVGGLVEGGWNWVGFQCTYIQYRNHDYGSFDASNCGVRFTFHFRKWHPTN